MSFYTDVAYGSSGLMFEARPAAHEETADPGLESSAQDQCDVLKTS